MAEPAGNLQYKTFSKRGCQLLIEQKNAKTLKILAKKIM
jgi:hypothetical protein